jgi:type II secretory pathway pseudopilin PulG
MTDSSVYVSWTNVTDNTYTVTLKSVDNTVYTTISTNETSNGYFTLSDLDAGQEYEVSVSAEMTIGGLQYSSADSVISFTTYHCDVSSRRANLKLYSSNGVEVTEDYLRSDASTIFNISCDTGYEPDLAEGETIDNTTSCIGANTWSTYTDCKVQEEAAKQENDSDVVVGVVLGILAVVIIIAIILILIYRRNQRKSSSNRYNPSAEEKKSNEKADGGEAWRNPYYVENEKGTPDIPEDGPIYDNDVADKGDNVSQEVKIEFQDNDEDGNEVHENKLADANV